MGTAPAINPCRPTLFRDWRSGRRSGRRSVGFRRKDLFPQAIGPLDREIGFGLAKFLQGAIDGFDRIIEMTLLPVRGEKRKVGLREVFLSPGPFERRARGADPLEPPDRR
jgi:hypothetical protein